MVVQSMLVNTVRSTHVTVDKLVYTYMNFTSMILSQASLIC
ncbi:hypothetical protein Hdeb2414_s0007g00228021 [Helianthus debilis subsp. tardiflorus]